MLDSIIDAVKGEAYEALTTKLGLNGGEVDTVLSSSKEAVEKSIADETSNNGVDTLLNLFSGSENSGAANDLLSGLGGNLISSLTNNGFDSGKSSQIKDIVLPLVIGFISKKIGGDSSNLASLLGGLAGGGDKSGGLLGNIGGSLLKGLFK